MAKVRVHPGEGLNWVTLRSLYPAHMAAEMSDAELDSLYACHESGTNGSLHLTEQKYLPHAHFDLHAHDQAEIIYVIEGMMILGSRKLGPGSSVFIDKDTLYEFSAGSDGLRILIFMADGNASYASKKEYLRRRQLASQPG